MNAWEYKFLQSINKQRTQGKTLTSKQQFYLDKINSKYNLNDKGEVDEDSLTHKQRYGRCEDAPCCGCCGQNVYYNADEY